MSEQLNIHGGAERLRAAACYSCHGTGTAGGSSGSGRFPCRACGGTGEPPADAAPPEPLFEFPSGLRGQMDLGGPIRDLDAWAETVVPDA